MSASVSAPAPVPTSSPWPEFHVRCSDSLICVNPASVTKIGICNWQEFKHDHTCPEGSFIGLMDGQSVNVRESYAEVKKSLESYA
jgi:hypothetical protein